MPRSSRGQHHAQLQGVCPKHGIHPFPKGFTASPQYLGVDKDLPEQGLDVVVGSSHNNGDLVPGKDIFNVPESRSVSRDAQHGGRAVGSRSLGLRSHYPSPREPVRLQDRVRGVPHFSLSSVASGSHHQNSGKLPGLPGRATPSRDLPWAVLRVSWVKEAPSPSHQQNPLKNQS